MSLEDAEILLANEQYINCEPCLERIRQQRRILNAHCMLCGGWGSVANPVYVAAALRAGLPIPVTVDVAKEMQINELMKKMKTHGVKLDRKTIDTLRLV